jgi:hypothetical protein
MTSGMMTDIEKAGRSPLIESVPEDAFNSMYRKTSLDHNALVGSVEPHSVILRKRSPLLREALPTRNPYIPTGATRPCQIGRCVFTLD